MIMDMLMKWVQLMSCSHYAEQLVLHSRLRTVYPDDRADSMCWHPAVAGHQSLRRPLERKCWSPLGVTRYSSVAKSQQQPTRFVHSPAACLCAYQIMSDASWTLAQRCF